MINSRRKFLLAQKTSTPPIIPLDYLTFYPGDVYILDCQVTQGAYYDNQVVMDIEWNWTYSYIESGWCKLIGLQDRGFMGLTKYVDAQYTAYRCAGARSGPQGSYYDFGGLYYSTDSESFNSKIVGRRLWCMNENGFELYTTSGGGQIGTRLVSKTDSYPFQNGGGTPFRIGGISDWEKEFKIYEITIYNIGTITPVKATKANYIPAERAGIQGLYNVISGKFIPNTRTT